MRRIRLSNGHKHAFVGLNSRAFVGILQIQKPMHVDRRATIKLKSERSPTKNQFDDTIHLFQHMVGIIQRLEGGRQ